MYSVSKEMPLSSYQVIQPSENQTNFLPGQIIRFTIPRSSGFWDAHLSKLQFLVETSGANYKMCFSSAKAGVASMIDMIRLTQNGRVISEVQEYATLQHVLKDYGSTLSQEQTESLYNGCVDCLQTANTEGFNTSNAALLGQGLNRSGDVSMAAAERPVKFQMYLDCVSLFERLQVVPSAFMGDILVEIRLVQDATHIMKVLPATGQTFTMDDAFATPIQGDDLTRVQLTPPFIGFTCLADSPFVVGQEITFTNGGTRVINALEQAPATGVITIRYPTITPGATYSGSTTFTITKGTDNQAPVNPATGFVVSSSELLLQIVKPPDSYVSDLASQIESEGFFLDVDSVTTYRANVLQGIKEQTVTVPTTQSRAQAILSVPRKGNQTVTWQLNNGADYRHEGQFSDLLDYRSQINGIYYPNQGVDLSVMCGQVQGGNTYRWHFSQEHLRELEKSYVACDKPFRSVNSLMQDFVIGRALSSKGSTTDLTATPINIYLKYQANGPSAPTDPKDMLSYVFHKVRVGITPAGIEVMV